MRILRQFVVSGFTQNIDWWSEHLAFLSSVGLISYTIFSFLDIENTQNSNTQSGLRLDGVIWGDKEIQYRVRRGTVTQLADYSRVWCPGCRGGCRRWLPPRCPGSAGGPACSQTESPVSRPPHLQRSSCSCQAILPWFCWSVRAA